MPQRIQLKRTAGWRIANHSNSYVIIDRRGVWGNPWTVHPFGKKWDVRLNGGFPVLCVFNTKNEAQALAVSQFKRWLTDDGFAATLPGMGRFWILEHLHELAGKDLACWCPPELACHADAYFEVLAELGVYTSGGA